MKTVIFAGGLGTRITEESATKPKPMVEIGGRPLLWHIMSMYSLHGVKEFIVCLGYKGYVIKEYFYNYYRHTADVTIDLATDTHQIHRRRSEDWTVTLVDTGLDTQTGGRLRRIEPYLENATFAVTYGDGLADIDISAERVFHQRHGKSATVAAIQPRGRFGRLDLSGDCVTGFEEKPKGEFGWVNGGFFLFEPDVLKQLRDDSGPMEQNLLPELIAVDQLRAYRHEGFWQSCDTMRDKLELEAAWKANAPWLK